MKNKAFTVLEIMVVISILAILAAVAVPRLRGMQQDGNTARARADLNTLKAAVDAYYLAQPVHTYPATNEIVQGKVMPKSGTWQKVSAAPYDPFGATTTTLYNYMRSSPSGKFYVLWSVGVNAGGSVTAINDTTGVVTKTGSPVCVTNGSGC
ncbi:MAG: prepilin-type N-terminal cleavage/methylation domain-containing protein [Candidatus Omnitrophica bacterium]|nr:prepilin-type N-terminal cleavage/methylation domain-containing protein [Candidatus Omnitrophota bacterium]